MTNFTKIKQLIIKTAPYFTVFILAVLIVKWYFFNLGSAQIWNDEYSHVFAAKSLIANGKPLLLSGLPYTRALIYTYMVAASYRFLGVSEFSSRLPSLIAGFSILIVFFLALKKTSKSTTIAIIGLSFLAFDPAMYWWSRTCRMYILQAFVFFIGVLAYYFAFEDFFSKKSLIKIVSKFGASSALFILSFTIQPLTLLFAPVMIIYPFIHPKSRFDKRKITNYGIALAAVVVFYLILRYTVPQLNIIRLGEIFAKNFIPPNFKMNWASDEGYYLGFLLTNYMIVIPFFVFGVYLSFREKNSLLVLCSLTSVIIVTILSTVFAILVDSRFLLFVLPFIYMPAAVGAYSFINMLIEDFNLKEIQIYALTVVIFFAAVLAGKANLQNLTDFKFAGSEDFRGISEYIAKQPGYNKNQTVISTLPLATIYYLHDTDYWIRQVIDKRFIVNKNGDRVEYYSGVKILDNPKVLANMLGNQKVWLVTDTKRYRSYLKDDMKTVITEKMKPVAQLNGVRLFVNNRYAGKNILIEDRQ